MSERDLIRQFRRDPPGHPCLLVGPGDDCAILRWRPQEELAFKIDQIVEGTHFVLEGPHAATPRDVGWKATAKTFSDIAAMGFWPVAVTVAVNLRRGLGDAWALALHQGIKECCLRYQVALAGGDITSSDSAVSVCVSALGGLPEPHLPEPLRASTPERPGPGLTSAWLRSGAKPGDWLLCTGALGGAPASRRHLQVVPRLEEARVVRRLLAGSVHACIDITDGLARDLHHLCAESGCGAELEARRVPLHPDAERASRCDGKASLTHALSDGEDFELLLALEPEQAAGLLEAWRQLPGLSGVPLTVVGRALSPEGGVWLLGEDGTRAALEDIGYEHQTGG